MLSGSMEWLKGFLISLWMSLGEILYLINWFKFKKKTHDNSEHN